jgi:hypothetical protein
MASRLAKTLVVVAATATTVALATGTAQAASMTAKVTAGSAAVGTAVPFTAATTGTSPQVTFTDVDDGNLALHCASATSATNSATVGSQTFAAFPSPTLATIDGAGTTWNTCTGPLGLTFVVTGSTTWNVVATGLTSGGITAGRITNVHAHVADGTTCVFDVTGTVDGTYTNGTSTSTLTLPGVSSNLLISNATGGTCAAAGILSGDHAKFQATLSVTASTPANNPIGITVTSP